jgi:NAD(P) transhydrogenase subunit beta
MPILNVDKARSIIVVKRSMKPGFQAARTNCSSMKDHDALGDARETIVRLVTEIKQL